MDIACSIIDLLCYTYQQLLLLLFKIQFKLMHNTKPINGSYNKGEQKVRKKLMYSSLDVIY